MNFALCLEKRPLGEFSADDVQIGRLYEVVEADAGNGMMRILDDSGEDYLYPPDWFAALPLPDAIADRLHDALSNAA